MNAGRRGTDLDRARCHGSPSGFDAALPQERAAGSRAAKALPRLRGS